MNEFIGIGDLHLTSPGPRGNIGGLSSYVEDHDNFVADLVINQPLRYAKKRDIKDIVLYGDLFEKPRASYEGMLALLRIFSQSSLQFHVILGNHDMFGLDPSLGHSLQIIEKMNLPNVKIYTEPTQIGKVNFLPYPHSKFSKKHLNIAHIDVAGAKSDSGRLMDSDELPTSSATAVVGHIHTNQRVRNTYYSGTLYQTNFGESPDKFFHHCVYESGDWEIHNIPVKPVYSLHTIEVSKKKDLKDVPASKFDLIKLILLSPGISAEDYKHLNVVRTRAIANDQDLALARVEDLHDGEEIEFSVDEFFDSWLAAQPLDDDLKSRTIKLRHKLLRGGSS